MPGLVLSVVGAGGAASLKAAQLARKADLPLAVSLVVVLQLVNVVALPLWVGSVVTDAYINSWVIVRGLLGLVLLPLSIGLIGRARYGGRAVRWRDGLVKLANLALVVALAAGIVGNWGTIVTMAGSWVIVTALAVVLVAGGLGVLAGRLGGASDVFTTTGLVTVFRFESLGLFIISSELGGNPTYLGPALMFALIDFLLPLAVAVRIGRRGGAIAPTRSRGWRPARWS